MRDLELPIGRQTVFVLFGFCQQKLPVGIGHIIQRRRAVGVGLAKLQIAHIRVTVHLLKIYCIRIKSPPCIAIKAFQLGFIWQYKPNLFPLFLVLHIYRDCIRTVTLWLHEKNSKGILQVSQFNRAIKAICAGQWSYDFFRIG